MFINEDFRRVVGYLAYDEMVGKKCYRTPGATVFFLGLFEEDRSATVYAVTARHCISPKFKRFYIQSNETDEIETTAEDWVLHPKTDIAVCRLGDQIQPTCLKMFVSGGVNSGHIKCGHNVFLVGLFDPLPGSQRVEPIVRFGHVSLPEARAEIILDVATNKQEQVDAHLIETRSWGGESGSPVFVHGEYYRTPMKHAFDKAFREVGGLIVESDISALEVDCRLLGLLHGHFEVERPQQHKRYDKKGRVADVNAGIAVVIPARHIWNLLMTDKRLIEDRKTTKRKPNLAVPDSNDPKSDLTKSDFEVGATKGKPES